MDSLSVIRDLYQHMAWADAAVWRGVLASEPARGDRRILELLQHCHETQKAFLWIWQGVPFDQWSREELNAEVLARSARTNHADVMRFVDAVAADSLDARVVLPWAARVGQRLGREVHDPTLGETLLQVPSHSTHHRAQASARLRELGGEPPLTDFIAWVWFGKPPADWPAETA